ncbi:toll/interleukin-1 receptor domain-containing protein [uncultured Thiohalocapsa sp.]|uniref:toll/interleukin-1 receptor domain-containing protein n=1 Tax=uncultured Thiohalocapsa sp. TaxID=768990 RepID=UPI0025DFFD32|nr:toll/interleukin-1 receptor domain-containing protein [uncultured Thiohalocapsa sp.]
MPQEAALLQPPGEISGLELRNAGHQVWLDKWEIGVGDSIVERINSGLTGIGYLVLCYSAAGPSHWTDREWQSTLHRQLSGQPVKILPARISGGGPPAILADIRYADLVVDWRQGVADLLAAIR